MISPVQSSRRRVVRILALESLENRALLTASLDPIAPPPAEISSPVPPRATNVNYSAITPTAAPPTPSFNSGGFSSPTALSESSRGVTSTMGNSSTSDGTGVDQSLNSSDLRGPSGRDHMVQFGFPLRNTYNAAQRVVNDDRQALLQIESDRAKLRADIDGLEQQQHSAELNLAGLRISGQMMAAAYCQGQIEAIESQIKGLWARDLDLAKLSARFEDQLRIDSKARDAAAAAYNEWVDLWIDLFGDRPPF